MTKRLIAMLVLTFALSACESSTTDNNSNSNAAAPNTNAPAVRDHPASTPAQEPSPAIKTELKAGDKVKVTSNGSTADATVVSVDEKAGKVTVRVQGDKQDKTVAVADV